MNSHFNDTPFIPSKREQTVRVVSYAAERHLKFQTFYKKFADCPRKMKKGITVWNELQRIDFDDGSCDLAFLKNHKVIHKTSFMAREIDMANIEFLDFIDMAAVVEKFG